MILALDVWLLPAIAAGSSSYLVSLVWERLRPATAPTWLQEIFLSGLSFIMGAICAYYRHLVYARTLENNTIAMFVAGVIATYAWLCLRKYMPLGGRRMRR